MLQTASLGRTLPLPPVIAPQAAYERDAQDDLAACAAPRPPVAVARLARRILSGSLLAKHWIGWASVSVALWAIGTAIAIVVGGGGAIVLALGFGGLAGGGVAGAAWFCKRYLEARTIAREGQLVVGVATFRRSRETLGGELSETLGALLGETCHHSVVFSIGFIRHEVRVAFADAHDEGEPCSVLVQPGARYALAFDRHGRAHVGELLRIG